MEMRVGVEAKTHLGLGFRTRLFGGGLLRCCGLLLVLKNTRTNVRLAMTVLKI